MFLHPSISIRHRSFLLSFSGLKITFHYHYQHDIKLLMTQITVQLHYVLQIHGQKTVVFTLWYVIFFLRWKITPLICEFRLLKILKAMSKQPLMSLLKNHLVSMKRLTFNLMHSNIWKNNQLAIGNRNVENLTLQLHSLGRLKLQKHQRAVQ